jgi:hypothetical protein
MVPPSLVESFENVRTSALSFSRVIASRRGERKSGEGGEVEKRLKDAEDGEGDDPTPDPEPGLDPEDENG